MMLRLVNGENRRWWTLAAVAFALFMIMLENTVVSVVLLVALAMFGVFFFVSLYMQNILGYSAVRAGAAFLPMTLLIVAIALVAGRLSDRIGSRWLLAFGMTVLAAPLFSFSRLGIDESYWSLAPGMLLGGIGMATVMSPATAAALSGVPVGKAGVGSAVVNSSRQVGGSIGIALWLSQASWPGKGPRRQSHRRGGRR